MTGRRLYELVCDGWEAQGQWARKSENITLLPPSPVAWPFLTGQERRMFNHVARRLKGIRRTPA